MIHVGEVKPVSTLKGVGTSPDTKSTRNKPGGYSKSRWTRSSRLGNRLESPSEDGASGRRDRRIG